MDNKEIILSKIAEILSRKGFFFKSNLHLNQDLNALDWENFLLNMRITCFRIITITAMPINLKIQMKNMMCFLDWTAFLLTYTVKTKMERLSPC